jgi:hypothetical protein
MLIAEYNIYYNSNIMELWHRIIIIMLQNIIFLDFITFQWNEKMKKKKILYCSFVKDNFFFYSCSKFAA